MRLERDGLSVKVRPCLISEITDISLLVAALELASEPIHIIFVQDAIQYSVCLGLAAHSIYLSIVIYYLKMYVGYMYSYYLRDA